jgi:SAM-dependent methyltransferase
VQIDEEGYPLFDGLRVQDKQFGLDLIAGIEKSPEGRTFFIKYKEDKYILEAFDEPYVVQMVYKNLTGWEIELPYGLKKDLTLKDLTVDEWDRFHGRTAEDIPFVFSRKAQNEFFNLVDEFNDDGFYIDETFYEVLPYWQSHAQERQSKVWSDRYKEASNQPPWDMKSENPLLREILPQIKIPKSRILVLGCGNGHDANFFAKAGHLVTGVDFSGDAIEQAQKLYADTPDLKFIQADVFKLPENFEKNFDIVFEHTLFCAIDPTQRNDLIKVYRQCLNEHGHLLGIFFTIDNFTQPPFGGTEWEYRQRLKKSFQNLYWTRWRGGREENLISKRSLGSELVVYARKI